ncbi:electron transport complex protein [Candidatus Photodesmus blepharus]|uniref:Ion-translocating oxidoreductase complex subunit B n=1 Tax=Candidatus Photodesmus blepharonis TaxID=1179155 RepID=A0A084CN19_9GAMM|nr:electron transport complex subunit RsxB [Candidatus Photodesmus blepharus]KEY91198.1 electron transport complex protein [Candidatus Photodesmus blepharus]
MYSILIAVLTIVFLAAIFGATLGFASNYFKVKTDPIVNQIDSILPQTQCGQCGYPGCRPYAEAVANGEKINKCLPGGVTTIENIANLMNVEAKKYSQGVKKIAKTIAFIHEDMCIGCTKCIKICPVDAIVGGIKKIHTVIENECTGCDLCVAPCPTNCIEMIPVALSASDCQASIIPILDITDTT